MALPASVRIFFAIDLKPQFRKVLAKHVSAFKKQATTNAIRWSKTQNFHVTLHFLPEVRLEDLPPLIETVRREIEELAKKFVLNFGEIKLFPSPYRPRVIVLEMQPNKMMDDLVEKIGSVIKKFNYKLDERPFRPHVTIGRLKSPKLKLDFLRDQGFSEMPPMHVDEVVLFRSEPQPEGSLYTELALFKLKEFQDK